MYLRNPSPVTVLDRCVESFLWPGALPAYATQPACRLCDPHWSPLPPVLCSASLGLSPQSPGLPAQASKWVRPTGATAGSHPLRVTSWASGASAMPGVPLRSSPACGPASLLPPHVSLETQGLQWLLPVAYLSVVWRVWPFSSSVTFAADSLHLSLAADLRGWALFP